MHSLTHPTPARTRWTHYTSLKAIPPFIIKPGPAFILPPTASFLCLLRSFVLCLPCLYISCSQQLKPGWSMSCLAGTANLHIVPFIRLAPTHNKTLLTRSLKSAARTQCVWVMIAFQWAVRQMPRSICSPHRPLLTDFFFPLSKCDHRPILGWIFRWPIKCILI